MKHEAIQHCGGVVWSVRARLLQIVAKTFFFVCARCAHVSPWYPIAKEITPLHALSSPTLQATVPYPKLGCPKLHSHPHPLGNSTDARHNGVTSAVCTPFWMMIQHLFICVLW